MTLAAMPAAPAAAALPAATRVADRVAPRHPGGDPSAGTDRRVAARGAGVAVSPAQSPAQPARIAELEVELAAARAELHAMARPIEQSGEAPRAIATQRRPANAPVHAARAAGRAADAQLPSTDQAPSPSSRQQHEAHSRFLATARHDLRQPLQALALLQALLASAVTGEKAHDLVARQHRILGTLTDMLDTLFAVGEIEAGAGRPAICAFAPAFCAFTPAFCVFAIDDVLARIGSELVGRAQARSIGLRIVPCRQIVRSDPRLLEQMIRHLVSDAIACTPQGRVLVGCRQHGDMLAIEVWDTGPGIAPADLPLIFKQCPPPANVTLPHGRGLGLAVVDRLANLLGHTVGVRSRLGHSSGFAIAVPRCARADARAPPAAWAGLAGRIRPLRLLVVEDDPEAAAMLGALLRGHGHDVTIAPDGPSALACVARRVIDPAQPCLAQPDPALSDPGMPDPVWPDLVLADYHLPNGPNGLHLAAALRAIAGAALPVIILTGDTSSATRRAVTHAGCSLLAKPVSVADLRQAIARALLPPDAEASLPPDPSASLPPDAAASLIFVVDDDDTVRGALLETLQADGRKVAGFASGEAFLEAFRPDGGQCVLIDAGLPGMSGIDLLETLRAVGHDLPAIVITGQSDVPMAIRAMKAGASDFIEKPVDGPDLLASLARALERSLDAAKITAWQKTAAAQMALLTPRQREIMTLVLAGHPSKNIAADLGISQRTVENHRASIMHRTGVTSLPALARLALAAAYRIST